MLQPKYNNKNNTTLMGFDGIKINLVYLIMPKKLQVLKNFLTTIFYSLFAHTLVHYSLQLIHQYFVLLAPIDKLLLIQFTITINIYLLKQFSSMGSSLERNNLSF